MNTNPYSPPETLSETQSDVVNASRENPVARLFLLVVCTAFGGLVGNAVGNFTAHSLSYLGRSLRMADMYEIAHGIGFTFLVIGALIGSWLSTRFATRTSRGGDVY